ncbi:MAG: hypothetical protein KJ069_11510 [Anaerolineae bacterium]|nr:hypothetical protein [Anaerolineae bacterium]
MDSKESGPFVYENWKLFLSGKPLQAVWEYPLFTDAHIIGEIRNKYGPYQLLNTVPNPPDSGNLAPSIILRTQMYTDSADRMSMENTNTERFHGGLLSDEIAALVALCMGIRTQAGGATRYFTPENDPQGQPINWFSDQNPTLVKRMTRGAILPRALHTHNLEQTHLLGRLTELSASEAIALVRAARLYQDAVWIIESEPELAWLFFVSAIEIAANHWFQAESDAMVTLEEAKPDLVTFLDKAAGQAVAQEIAREFAPYLRSSKKFRDFAINFLPDPLQERPEELFQVSWNTKNMKKALVQIYDYRSRALHGGIPFPLPMCIPASAMKEEKPLGLATSAYGSVWLAKDTPMLLHVFEHIVRHALLNWWESMLSDENDKKAAHY